MALSRRLRYEILRRDNFACRYCGAKAPDADLTVDHVVPIALGGDDAPTNLVTSCHPCNAGKSSVSPDTPIVEGVSDEALRFAEAMKQAAALQAVDRERRDKYADEFDEAWSVWHIVGTKEPVKRPINWRNSIERFCELGIEIDVLLKAIPAGMARWKGEHAEFRYVCGIAWSTYRERQEIARQLLASEGTEQ